MKEAGNGHTPGPWKVEADMRSDRIGDMYDSDRGYREYLAGWNIVADGLNDVVGIEGIRPSEEGEANACLIAAAPDLLAFAQMILDESDHQYQRDAARAVIAKATPSIESEIAVLEQGSVG